jgi:geranylgeranyl diphosphate synthase, type I
MEYITHFKQAIKSHIGHIESWVSTHTDELMSIFADDVFRTKTVDFIVSWGKRLRPILWLITALDHGNMQVCDDVVYPFLSLEAFHKFILSHDDIVDKDVMRYGKETVHKAIEKLMPPTSQDTPAFFGNSLGMIAWDVMNSISHDYILHSNCDPAIKVELLKLMSKTLKETVYGWYIQFIMDYQLLSEVSLDRVIESLIWVTGRYTFSFPIKFGLTYINQSDSWNTNYAYLCDYMGVLFQTGDDLIGLFGDPEETGKSDYSDITQGKKTIPMLLTYQNATPEQQAILEQLVGKPELTSDEVKYVRTLVLEHLPQIRAFMQDYGKKCMNELEQLTLPQEQYNMLRGCIEYMLMRDQESNLKV